MYVYKKKREKRLSDSSILLMNTKDLLPQKVLTKLSEHQIWILYFYKMFKLFLVLSCSNAVHHTIISIALALL